MLGAAVTLMFVRTSAVSATKELDDLMASMSDLDLQVVSYITSLRRLTLSLWPLRVLARMNQYICQLLALQQSGMLMSDPVSLHFTE